MNKHLFILLLLICVCPAFVDAQQKDPDKRIVVLSAINFEDSGTKHAFQYIKDNFEKKGYFVEGVALQTPGANSVDDYREKRNELLTDYPTPPEGCSVCRRSGLVSYQILVR